MYDTRKDLLDAFRAGPEVIYGLLVGVSQKQAQSAKGGDEDWSVVEVVCHLRDAEERGIERLRAMRDEEEPFLAGYDQEAWARERDYASADLRQALADFLRYRAQHIAELESLPADAWNRIGVHEEQGKIDILNHTLHLVAHDSLHAAQISRQLRRQ